MGHGKGERNAALDAQAQEVRELLAEVRGATGDLTRLLREARTTLKEITEEQIQAHVTAELASLSAQTNEAIDQAVTAVFARFDNLTKLLIHGGNGIPAGQRNPIAESAGIDVEALVHQRVAARRELGKVICPYCGMVGDNDVGTRAPGAPRRPAYALCFQCEAWYLTEPAPGGGWTSRATTPAENAEIAGDETAAKFAAVLRRAKSRTLEES